MPTGTGSYGSKRGRPKGSKNKTTMKKQGTSDRTNEKQGMEIKGLKDKMKKASSKKGKSSSAKGKVFTAKNGRKYIKLANGRTRFIKG
tara:strand:+ start:308 stop:571 length:264 start_codon:yes stop_codon:yes gene_type:complete